MYNRISIVGGSGTGKSTLCDILAKKLNLPAIHLDAINFEANWVEIDKNKRDKIINERANEDKWKRCVVLSWKHLWKNILM